MKFSADQNNKEFRETCEELIENEGICMHISCSKCPFGFNQGNCTDNFGFSPKATEPDPKVVETAKLFLERSPHGINSYKVHGGELGC